MKKAFDNIVLGIAVIGILVYVVLVTISFSTNDPKKQFISEPQKELINE